MPAGTFRDHKQRELRFKLRSLPLELEQWRLKAVSHQPLAKNHSQIERVTYRIEGFQKKVEADLEAAIGGPDLWRSAETIEKKALLVHMVWDFFRTHFSLRIVPPFDRYLALADAFARACYEPAIRLINSIPAEQLCRAPLVTFNDQISPWAKPAEVSAEEDNPATNVTVLQLTRAVESMPIALLGVPWSYLTYLPHMALLAHEAGHAVERDGGLTAVLQNAVENANLKNPAHKPAWHAWTREVFADVFGCWMAGPAFVWAMADYLATEQTSIAKQTRPQINGEWTSYPTSTLRVRLGCQVLEKTNFSEQASLIRNAWATAYPEYNLGEFEEDFGEISSGLAQAARLPENHGRFVPALFKTAVTSGKLLSADARLGNDPQPPQCYVTTAHLLMQNGSSDAEVSARWEQLIEHHLVTRSPDLLGPGVVEPGIDAESERQQGAELADLV